MCSLLRWQACTSHAKSQTHAHTLPTPTPGCLAQIKEEASKKMAGKKGKNQPIDDAGASTANINQPQKWSDYSVRCVCCALCRSSDHRLF